VKIDTTLRISSYVMDGIITLLLPIIPVTDYKLACFSAATLWCVYMSCCMCSPETSRKRRVNPNMNIHVSPPSLPRCHLATFSSYKTRSPCSPYGTFAFLLNPSMRVSIVTDSSGLMTHGSDSGCFYAIRCFILMLLYIFFSADDSRPIFLCY
jgi:hypothetical protein